MIRAIVFDCFGVLVGQGFDATWRRAGGDPDKDRKFIEDLLGAANIGYITLEEMTAKVCERLSVSRKQWEAAVVETELPDQTLLDYIRDELKPHYKLAVLSNANAGTLERVLSQAQRDVFDALVVSAEVGHIKPDAEIYLLAAERLGVLPDECVFTDDNVPYCSGADSVGMKSILFRDSKQFKHELTQHLNHV